MQHAIGTILEGTVNNITTNGIYVTIDNESFGFLPNVKMPSYLNAEGKYAGGKYDRVKVVVEDIRQEGMLLFCDFDYWVKLQVAKEFSSRFEPGTIFPCEVKSVSDSTATILVSNTVEGYISKDQLGWNAINKVSDVLYVGEPINAVFIGTDNVRLLFGLKYLQKKPYDDSLYDLSLDDLLKYCGHSGTEFVGECHKRGPYVFLENLYSINPGEEGKILTDKKYGYNLRAIVPGNNSSLVEGSFYKFKLALVPKETRLERNQLFQFRASNLTPVRNPYSDDVHKAFKKNISPATNITASHLLAEVGKNMYSSKDRMFFELIQNADDASSENGVSVSVKTDGDYLTVVHNGFSFDREDFEAITSAANGTKKANENKTGYKGIGFKSVFTDSEEVYIRTGGYQFKYQKSHPFFNDFEKFYFFVNELKSREQKDRFLDRFSSERAHFKGVSDIPWQLEPIRVKTEAFPPLSSLHSGANVAIARKLGADKIEGDNGYRKAIEAVIDKPKFMLFLRNTNRIDFNERSASKEIEGNRIILKNSFGIVRQEVYERKDFTVKTDDQAFLEKGFDIKRKIENEEEGKILEATFVNSRNQEYENIPNKLAISQSTDISFAVKVTDDEPEYIDPDTSCTDVSMFAFLPTLVKEFKFPFYINANFVLDPPRQHILSDNPWNCFLIGEIGELVVKWCADLCIRREPKALNILPITLFNESESDVTELAQAFNKRYKAALESVPYILCADNKLHPAGEVLVDKTGLSKIVGETTFCDVLGSSKHLPSVVIDCSPLDNELFSSVEKVSFSQLSQSLVKNKTKANIWFKDASDTSKDAFLSWLEKYSDSLSGVAPNLALFKIGDTMISASEITVNKSRIVTTDRIKPIKEILQKVGFGCTEYLGENSKLKVFAPIQQCKEIFDAISSKDLKDLTKEEKLLLIKHLAGFENVGPSSIASLSVFHNLSDVIKPMGTMMPFVSDYPEWIKPFMIKEDDSVKEIQAYLVPKDQAFEKLILPKLSEVQIDIKSLYQYFQWSDSRISRLVIDRLKADGKLGTFIDVVKDLEKGTKEYYLQSIDRIDLSEEVKYSKESFEHKVLSLAISAYEDPSIISERVYVGDKCLKEFSITDRVCCTYTSSGINKTVNMSLSRLLPDYENLSGSIEKVKALFDSSIAWDKLLKAKRKTPEWVETELNKKLEIPHASYAAWVTGAGNAQQYLFSVYRRRQSWTVVKGFSIELENESEAFVHEMMDFLYENKLSVSESPFTCKINSYFSGKYINNEYITAAEKLLPKIENWADSEAKRQYLFSIGVRSDSHNAIEFRKAFIQDKEFTNYDSLTDADRRDSMTFIVSAKVVAWPVSGVHQVEYLNKILSLRYTPLRETIDTETLESDSFEMSTPSYTSWIANSFPKIFLFDGNMPMKVTHCDYSDILMRSSSGTHYYDSTKKVLYIDKNEEVEDLMFDIARGSKIPFNLDDYKAVFRVGMTSISNEELQKTQQKIEELTSELSAKDQLILRYKQLYGELDVERAQTPKESNTDNTDATIKKGKQEKLSLDEKVAAQLEAQRFLRETQPNWVFPEHYGEINIENGEPFHYSTIEIKDESGTLIPIVLKSHKTDGEPLMINTFEWTSITKDHARIFVYTGNDIKEIDVLDLVRNQPTVNVSFSTENLDIEERISAFAESLRYFKELHFDFDSFNLSKQARSLAGMYNENERRQGTTSDKTDL